jgi:hypothetical protein
VSDDDWRLGGECILAWVPACSGDDPTLPAGLKRLLGRAAVVGIRYDDSPFGPYLELTVARPARLGLRPALSVTDMVGTSAEAVIAARERWGLPAKAGTLRWSAETAGPVLTWEEGAVTLRARPWGPGAPVVVPAPSLQRLDGRPVVVPRRFGARMRLAGVAIKAPPSGSLAWLNGRHPGAVMAGVRVTVRPARRPMGLRSSVPMGVDRG